MPHFLIVLILMFYTTVAVAGTADLTGVYKGGQSEDYFQQTHCTTYTPSGNPVCGNQFGYQFDSAIGGLSFQAFAHTDGNWMTAPVLMGWSFNKNGLWTWDFNNSGSMQIDQNLDGILDTTINYDGMLTLGSGHHYDANTIAGIDYPVDGFHLTIGVPWTANNRTSGIPIIDNGDGSYTGFIEFTVFNTAFGPNIPHAWLEITWEITNDGAGNLTMVTMDADGNGFPGTVPGDPANGDFAGFPFPFEPRWDGTAAPAPDVLIFATTTYTVNENAGTVDIEVSRVNDSSAIVEVDYTTVDGTALAAEDYVTSSGTLAFGVGDISEIITINIVDDTVFESDERFSLQLSNATGGAMLAAPGATEVTIAANDHPLVGVLEFSASSYDVNENGTSVTIFVTRSGGSAGAISVDYVSADVSAVASSDYTAVSDTLHFADGIMQQSFTVSILDDSVYEGNKTFNLNLSNVQGGASIGAQNSAIVTIIEDELEPPTLEFSADTYSVAESADSVQITVERSNNHYADVSVDYATVDGSAIAGVDYQATVGTASFTDETPYQISVPIINDVVLEGDKSFTITLSNAAGGAELGTVSSATITIVDNAAGTVQFRVTEYAVSEDDLVVRLTVVRQQGSAGIISVDYETLVDAGTTATEGEDFMPSSGTITFADGVTGQIVDVVIARDTVMENQESFRVKLMNPVGTLISTLAETTVQIQDDDTPGSAPAPVEPVMPEDPTRDTDVLGSMSIHLLLFLLLHAVWSRRRRYN